jgi:hypothetical protein
MGLCHRANDLILPVFTAFSECFNRDSETLGGGSAKIEILPKVWIEASARQEGQINRPELSKLRIRDQETREDHPTSQNREGEHNRHRQRRTENQNSAQDEGRMPQMRAYGSLLLAGANPRRRRVIHSVLQMRKLWNDLARDFIGPRACMQH